MLDKFNLLSLAFVQQGLSAPGMDRLDLERLEAVVLMPMTPEPTQDVHGTAYLVYLDAGLTERADYLALGEILTLGSSIEAQGPCTV